MMLDRSEFAGREVFKLVILLNVASGSEPTSTTSLFTPMLRPEPSTENYLPKIGELVTKEPVNDVRSRPRSFSWSIHPVFLQLHVSACATLLTFSRYHYLTPMSSCMDLLLWIFLAITHLPPMREIPCRRQRLRAQRMPSHRNYIPQILLLSVLQWAVLDTTWPSPRSLLVVEVYLFACRVTSLMICECFFHSYGGL